MKNIDYDPIVRGFSDRVASAVVLAGLDPAIYRGKDGAIMDHRVKPGDECVRECVLSAWCESAPGLVAAR